MKYIIIGGVAGGATAAARIRRNSETAEIILFDKGEYISYANCGLPYYIGGVIEDRDKLFVQTPEAFAQRLNVDIRTRSEVVGIDRGEKVVTVRTADGREYTESYDKLLLSPGASPVRPPLPGIDSEGIFTLRNISDTDRIKRYLQDHPVKHAVIVGGGFIGLEMAENLKHAGAQVAVVEMANQVMGPVDYSMASLVHEQLQQQGVQLYLEQAVEAFEPIADKHEEESLVGRGEGHEVEKGVKATEIGGQFVHPASQHRLVVKFKSGICLETDLVLLSIGVRAETRLAVASGLLLGEMRGIYVNEYLQTSDEHIYAVGDAIEYPHPVTGKPWLNFLAGPANRQARIVADNMVYGNCVKYEGSIGTAIAKVFDLTVASTGLPAKRLKQMEIPYLSSVIHSGAHAGYYPGALQMTIKITFSPTDGKLYGAQIVGYDGVDKRIDEFAMAIKHGDTIYDLMRLEHAYAPPFSSAKDPVAMSGYVAENILKGKVVPAYWRELRDADPSKVALIDVRTEDEFALGSIPGAINLPLDDLRDRLNEVPVHKPIIVFCGVGLRGYLASNILRDNGFDDVRNLVGGLKLYKAAVTEYTLQSASVTAEALENPSSFATALSGNSAVSAKSLENSSASVAVSLGSPLRTPTASSESSSFSVGMSSESPSTSSCQIDPEASKNVLKVDACGLQCPGPILKLKKSVEGMKPGERLEIRATDAGFPRDAEAWCRTTGNRFLSKVAENGVYKVLLEKATPCAAEVAKAGNTDKGKTFILFSDDLDKTLATFVLANGAAATGKKVTIFFTFWGLNAIKRDRKPRVKKDFFGSMFGKMLPSNTAQLKLSKMNMGGLGSKMMRYIMKRKGIESLESLRQQAIDNGVEFIACQMSMDVMGIQKEELLDNVTIGGVATYMDRAEEANVNLFI